MPAVMLVVDGETAKLKSGVGCGAMTTSVTVAMWVSVPEVAMKLSV